MDIGLSGHSVSLSPRSHVMLIALLVIACIYLAGLLVLAGAVWRAPEGFEDDNGFHTGRDSLTDDSAV